jgi:hypothetical protein
MPPRLIDQQRRVPAGDGASGFGKRAIHNAAGLVALVMLPNNSPRTPLWHGGGGNATRDTESCPFGRSAPQGCSTLMTG